MDQIDGKSEDKIADSKPTKASLGDDYIPEAGIGASSGPDLSSLNSHVRVTAKPGESAESLLRRFRQKVKDSGLMNQLDRLRFYEKPSQRKKRERKERLETIARAQRYNR